MDAREQKTGIEVTAVYHGVFERITGRRRETVRVDEPTFPSLVSTLSQRYGQRFRDTLIDPQTGYFSPGMIAFIGGRQADPNATLADGDEVVFMLAFTGGGP